MDMKGDKPVQDRDAAASAAASGRSAPLYQRAFEILVQQIEAGEIPADTNLQESHVAKRFGISRAPARQALALLEERGLVAKRESRGYRILVDAAHHVQANKPVAPLNPIRLSSRVSWEHIYGEVEGEIVARIAFGSWRVNEAELARHYGVSRTVARDVVGRLQQRGLVEKNERSHWYAPALTPEHIGELYELRWVLEPLALTKAAPHIPPAELARMFDRLQAAIADPENVDGVVLDALEEDLHVTLLHFCRNRALTQSITLHQSLLVAHSFLYRWTGRMFSSEPFLPEHLDIIEKLQAGASTKAATALEQHLRASLNRAIARVEDITARFEPDELSYLEPIGSPKSR